MKVGDKVTFKLPYKTETKEFDAYIRRIQGSYIFVGNKSGITRRIPKRDIIKVFKGGTIAT